jgi:ABC-type Fe3+-hydroxamate transport system substrate-binding protein
MPDKILFKPITRKAVLAALFLLSAWARPGSVYSQEDAYKADLEASRKLVKQFEKQVAENIEKTAALKALATKYPLVVLTPYSPDGYLGSGYDFVLETADPTKHDNKIQIRFGGAWPL